LYVIIELQYVIDKTIMHVLILLLLTGDVLAMKIYSIALHKRIGIDEMSKVK